MVLKEGDTTKVTTEHFSYSQVVCVHNMAKRMLTHYQILAWAVTIPLYTSTVQSIKKSFTESVRKNPLKTLHLCANV